MKKINLIDIYNNSLIIKILVFTVINLFLLPITIFLLLMKPFFDLKFVRLIDSRIGHLSHNTELFLRRLKLNIIKKSKRTKFIGIASTLPCNKQLLKMFKRQVKIIQVPKSIYHNYAFRAFSSNKSLLGMLGIYRELDVKINEYYEFNNIKSTLYFTDMEEKKGKELLEKLNVSNWFVCLHARDSTYLAKGYKGTDSSYHNFRDCDITNYLKAAKYISSKGGFALRVGAIVGKRLPNLNDLKIIDYATNCQSSFGDIYLCAKCKFFLGSTAGLYQVSTIFDVPIALANLIPLRFLPLKKGSLFIPKRIWSIKEKRFLTFKSIINSEIINFNFQEQYDKAGLKPVENTSEEIFDIAKEMNQRIDGTWKTTKEDEELQKKFKSLFKPNSPCYGFPSRIGAKFLRENKELLK
jgi:putative glycosyltransferase (TIGR04372 family)